MKPSLDEQIAGPKEFIKPRWQIERDEKRENAWTDPGLYQFICSECGVKSSKKLRAVKRYRKTCKCPNCGKDTFL